MSVVNVKVKYIRPKYQNLKEWINDKNNEYIGRGGVVFVDKIRYPSCGSVWANPYKDGTRKEIIEKYEIYIRNKLENDIFLRSSLKNLKNKNLGCWCKPENCHGDVLIKLIDEYSKNEN